MPSFFRGGVQKPPSIRSYHFKTPARPASFIAPSPFIASSPFIAPCIASSSFIAPAPVSSVFDSHDCIWYYGTVYVRENVAVSKLLGAMQSAEPQPMETMAQETMAQPMETMAQETMAQETMAEPIPLPVDDDDESVSSGNSSNCHNPRSIGKQNQFKYLKDGMRLRHAMLSDHPDHEWDHWYATFDAETNRVIRTPDGVAFDTLRQFSRLHCNEVLGTTATLTNVWSDPHFQYEDDEGQWHPLAKLKH